VKIAIIHNRFKVTKKREDGAVRALVVFQWFRFERDHDGWTLRILSFLSRITDTLEWTAHTGVINIGWHGRVEFAFVPGILPLIVIGEH
jgi:hypothetical protein